MVESVPTGGWLLFSSLTIVVFPVRNRAQPLSASAKFVKLLEQLDAEKEKGAITAYGVSITTLDEVFLLVARGDSARKQPEFRSSHFHAAINIANSSDDDNRSGKMDLENENLFGTHVQALWKKRGANFKRDKKAWFCTTVTPSAFVLCGLLILKYAVPDRDLQPLPLDLNDYNIASASSDIRNPIPFNTPEQYFGCNPGRCTMQRSTYVIDETNETYFFCGGAALEAALNESCLISDSKIIVDQIDEAGALGIPSTEETVALVRFIASPVYAFPSHRNNFFVQTSLFLLSRSFSLTASMYGGLFFTHDMASVTKSNLSFGETISELCANSTGDYMQESECDLYGTGIGYTVAYNFTALHSAVRLFMTNLVIPVYIRLT